MKPVLTRALLAVGLLVALPSVYAQPDQPASGRTLKQPAPMTQAPMLLPPGVPALHHALPASRAASAGMHLPQLGARPKSHVRSAVPLAATATLDATEAVSQEWAARYTGGGIRYDQPTSLAVDGAGNVAVTGYSYNGSSYDYATVVYAPAGLQYWVGRYNNPGNGDDIPTSLAVDGAGNVYVTGYSYSGSNWDYTTVKYWKSGGQAWVVQYNGSANSDDIPTSVAVDTTGNVYVTGTSYGSASGSYDYVTLKYAPSGQQLWEARYTGLGTDDLAAAVAVTATGEVLVTGTSYQGSQSDYVTLAYAGATGQQLWQARYAGPGSSYDLATGLAVDAAGNVAVTGTSDSGSSYDYATVKYATASGQQLWVARYNGGGNGYDEATAIALDATGNVLVTGFANTGNNNWDYATVKYAQSNGQELWQARYNGPANSYDEAKSLAVDAAGNVAVTGRSYNSSGTSDFATVRYAGGSGQQLWQACYSGPDGGNQAAAAVAVARGGNVVVAGAVYNGSSTSDTDFATITYAEANGQQLWVTPYAGLTPGADNAEGLVVDAVGNVYVTGSSSSDYATLKYSASGQLLWEARYNGPANGEDQATGLALDAAGNVYVTGRSAGSGAAYHYATVKYSASGQQLWVARYSGGGILAYIPTAVAVDAAGNAYVTGHSEGLSNNTAATLKYSTGGQLLWTALYTGFNNGVQATGLALDAAGNAYVTGSARRNNDDFDYTTLKYASASGQQLWQAHYSGPGSSTDQASRIALDVAGNVVVTGTSGSGSAADYVTVKYTGTTGQPLWEARYNGPANGEDQATGLAVDAAGNVYVTGRSVGSSASYDYATIKYASASGQQLWQARYSGPNALSDVAAALTVDVAGNVYVTGTSRSNSSNDYTTLKYAGSSGQQLWEVRYNGVGIADDHATAVAVDGAGNVYVTGSSTGGLTNSYDYATLKYAQPSGKLARVGEGVPQTALALLAPSLNSSKHQLAVYPNPAAEQATVSFRAALDGRAQVLLYNQLGQPVATLYAGAVRRGQFYTLPLSGQHVPAGLYTCTLWIGNQRQTTRLVINR
ncbi:SBBP repeat-containing protein [Hymenobacter tibetensis]|uniref:SBBP repeat-containing protein n=1 Tax=Hymenobacter tibetensis TaxID=497967 RepID=A0ABY4CSG6_9BACT|nr:SBBP repeat-containing protein [Hymenobacter tibetensis]UOG73189.1 SBBP repeat-containing protein [Hymenobacter tibetensis]